MRLINVHTLDMEKFDGENIPKYAILSHTWSTNSQDEVTFQEWEDGGTTTKPGYQKIVKSCERAKLEGLDYVWCDTVCINKKNHVELGSAIHSMFSWYRDSTVCYAYLSDVSSEDLRNSRWFTRGWTLQELLAPTAVIFLNNQWNALGTKSSLQPMLTAITGIDEHFLAGGAEALDDAPVGMRLSWLANRTTTLVEDMAYCMLGIFNVHMPFHYGQGWNAFATLQQEVVNTFNDDSIFAWTPTGDKPVYRPSVRHWVDLLALSPSVFSKYPRGFVPIPGDGRPHSRFSLDKDGLIFDVDCVSVKVPGSDSKHIIALLKDVGQSSSSGKVMMKGIRLKSLGESEGWVRDPNKPGLVSVVVDSNHQETRERLYVAPMNRRPGDTRVMQRREHAQVSRGLGFMEDIAPHFHRQEPWRSNTGPRTEQIFGGEVDIQSEQYRSADVERDWTWHSLIFILLRLMNDPVGLHIVVLITVAAFSQSSSTSCVDHVTDTDSTGTDIT